MPSSNLTSFANHANQRCFVIASGPSIKGMDLEWLKNETTICVNESYKAISFDPTYICIGDRVLWESVKETYAKKTSTIICSGGTQSTVGKNYSGDNLGLVFPLDMKKPILNGHFRHDLEWVAAGGNVMLETVLPFVLHCGFSECYLVGCDCNQAGYFYPENESAVAGKKQAVGDMVIPGYSVIQKYVTERGLTRIYNAGIGGNLNVFPRVKLDSMRPGAYELPLVVGYHTPHEKYKSLAENMKSSVERFGFDCVIREYPAQGKEGNPGHMNWVLNCALCGEVIRQYQEDYPNRNLIYLDADAVMEKRPTIYLDEPRDYDFAVPFLTNNCNEHKLQSNSMYFAANKRARMLVDVWIREQYKRNQDMLAGKYTHPFRDVWDQEVLEDVLPLVPDLRIRELPMTYGKIMPTPKGFEITPDVPLEKAVITQWQASREMRMKV